LNAPINQGKPDWLKIIHNPTEKYKEIKDTLSDLGINTLCSETRCPNIHQCWGKNNIVITIMGNTCTRACNDCTPGHPDKLDEYEVDKIVHSLRKLDIEYVTLNCIKRDDLRYMGAPYVAECIKKIKEELPWMVVETIIPDFKGEKEAVGMVVNSKPDVITHNIETVKSLHKEIKDPRSDFDKAISVLKTIKELDDNIYTKSMIMLGLGETKEEVVKAMQSLRGAKVDILVLGQYLKPKEWHSDVKEYVHPLVFDYLKTVALDMGFLHVESSPFARSSYMAGELFLKTIVKRNKKHGK